MGIDARIFERKSRTSLYFDRLTNLGPHVGDETAEYDQLYPIRWALTDTRNGIPMDDVVRLVRSNVEHGEECAAFWNAKIDRFATDHPDGEFFVVDDAGDGWDHDGDDVVLNNTANYGQKPVGDRYVDVGSRYDK